MNSNPAPYAAVDLGAESGRLLLGRFDGNKVTVTEVDRFENNPIRIAGALHWDILRIFEEVQTGLGRVASELSGSLDGIAIDCWAVDFGLLDRDGKLIANPHAYRDARTNGMFERAFARMTPQEIYQSTGVQLLQINTLYQLLAMEGSPLLDIAQTLLLIPDLIGYWLTGEIACEFTNATTTQLFDVERQTWAWELHAKMGIATGLFPKVVQPGAAWAPLLSEIRDEIGLGPRVPVIVVASHDTASAVVAVPAQDNNFAYISSGTWSLVGLELTQPIITSEALESNFSNEGGFAGRTRFLRNVMGLWLLQQCRRVWNKAGRDYSYDDLARMGESSPAFGCVVDPDDPVFLAPGDIPARIRAFCVETHQPPPETPAAIVRCILESLALKYRWVIEQAERLSGRRVDVIHVVGGGARNAALCQASADATGYRVLAGPVEATAIGNVMVQAYSQGRVSSLEDIRRVVAASTESRIYEPRPSRERWDSAYERLLEIIAARQTATTWAPREVPA